MPGKSPLPLLLFVLPGLLLTGCGVYRQQAWYVSPFHSNSQTYHALPLRTDSAHTAVYIQGALLTGHTNDNQTDKLKGGGASAFVAHHFGRFQAYYGLDLTGGCYTVGKFDTGHIHSFGDLRPSSTISLPPLTAPELEKYAGGKSFGSIGFSGGINMVKKTRRGEWRFIGLETTFRREFGNYLSFRKHLPDSLATVLIRSPFFATIGYTTEFIRRTSHGEFGFRYANGVTIGNAYQHLHDTLTGPEINFGYTTLNIHYTYGRYTVYAQTENGIKTFSVHLGFVYRFGRPGLPPKHTSSQTPRYPISDRRQAPQGPIRKP